MGGALTLGALGGGYNPAAADDCVALGGAIVGSECRISSAVIAGDTAHGGPFTLNETLRITGAGSISVPAAPGGNSLTLNITGDLIMDLPTISGGSRISGDVATGNGIGATITINATGSIVLSGNGLTGARISSNQIAGSCVGGKGGDISLTAGVSVTSENGSQITSTSVCQGGEITITAGLSASIDGLVSSEGVTTAVARGGPITITAACTLAVSDTGKVQSKGRDPGADRVHLQGGCEVSINGLVVSSAPGHLKPPPNRCHNPDRLDKPVDSPACVEVWSGGPLTINSIAPHNGEINADTGQSGGASCCAWIDLYARGDIKIVGDTAGPFSLHANQFLTASFGGLITVKSTEGKLTASGRAIQASATGSGSRGGNVTVEAKGDVTLDDAQIFAQGDFIMTGGFGFGGTIQVRAFSGDLSWQNLLGGILSTGDAQPTGSSVPAAQRGTITLNSCSPIVTTGTAFPVTAGSATTPTSAAGLCPPAEPAAPTLPGYVTLPDCLCAAFQPEVSVSKTTSTPTITAGETARYSVTVTAGGTGDSTNVTLTDVLPAGLTWTVGGPDVVACSPVSPVAGGATLTCTFGTMAPGDTKTITLSATTSQGSCPSMSNTARVSSDSGGGGNTTSGPITITVTCPDVRVVKSTTTPTISAGGSATYNITVTAGGTGSSTNVTLTDVLPGGAGLSWTVGGADAGACSPNPATGGSTLTCNFGTMAQGSTKTISLTATTTAANCPSISNTATVSAAVDGSTTNNKSGPITITVTCPDVRVVKSTTTPTISAGASATYNITVTAGGTGSSTNVTLTDVLPGGAGLSWTVGGVNAGACSPNPVTGGSTLTCNFGTMAQGSTKTISLTATTTAANCPSISNTATVSAAVDGNTSNNNSGPITITVNCPDVSVTKSTSTPNVRVGGTATYTITVTAGGSANSTNVVLTDTLPSGLTWTVTGTGAAFCSPASPVAGGTTLTCNFGTMTRGTSRTVTLTATTSAANCPSISNTATVSAAVDASPSNNSSGPITIVMDGCAGVTRGGTVGFWRNVNGHAILDPGHDGNLDMPVDIGGPTRGFHVTTILQSDKILANNACASGSPVIFAPCTLSPGLQTNTLGVLAAQTLALTYNIGKIPGYSGQTVSALGCAAKITSTLAALGLGSSSTVNQVLAVANNLINNSTSSGTTTQTQAADMNSLLGTCLNLE